MEEDFEEEIWNVQTQIKQYNIIQQKLEKLNLDQITEFEKEHPII